MASHWSEAADVRFSYGCEHKYVLHAASKGLSPERVRQIVREARGKYCPACFAAIKARPVCTRCNGRGGWEGWPGFTCFRCGGSGHEPETPVASPP